jgi:hypothetical protein
VRSSRNSLLIDANLIYHLRLGAQLQHGLSARCVRPNSVVAHLIEQLRHNIEFCFPHTDHKRSALKECPVPMSHVNHTCGLFAFYRILPFTQTQLNAWASMGTANRSPTTRQVEIRIDSAAMERSTSS